MYSFFLDLFFLNLDLRYIEESMIRRNYSESTIKTYLSIIKDYANYCEVHQLDTKNDAEPYIMYLIQKNAAISTQNQAINAIKYYWEKILGKKKEYINIERPLKVKKLPTVLSLEEVQRLLSGAHNLKHRTLLSTIYACGLRISEVCNLRISQINGDRRIIHIQQSKGKKDRVVPVPESLLKLWREYYLKFKPKVYLFEGAINPDDPTPKPYSPTSVRKLLHRLSAKVGILKKVNPHTLRHSYATHLYEKGINLRSIQVLLGHNSSKTTEIYTHVSNSHIANTPSPFDFLSSNAKFDNPLEGK